MEVVALQGLPCAEEGKGPRRWAGRGRDYKQHLAGRGRRRQLTAALLGWVPTLPLHAGKRNKQGALRREASGQSTGPGAQPAGKQAITAA